MENIIKIAGQIAGIGGLALGVFLLLFRELIIKKIFPNLTREHGYKILRLFMILTFMISVVGIIAWISSQYFKSLSINNDSFSDSKKDIHNIIFITEGIRPSQNGFRILFTIWNNSSNPIKIFDFYLNEYARLNTESYWSGPRSKLKIEKGESILWSGKTFEIIERQNESFDLDFIIDTGPKDGNPWVVFGIHSYYHNLSGKKKLVYSDAVYLYNHTSIFSITSEKISMLKDKECIKEYFHNLKQKHISKIYEMVEDALQTHSSEIE